MIVTTVLANKAGLGFSKLRPTSQVRPAKPFHPSGEIVCQYWNAMYLRNIWWL